MGQYQTFQPPLRKREDYTKEEIEKKYSTEQLTRLVLFDSVYKYPPRIYIPNKLCFECGKNPITKEFQLSENRECLECYAILKKENYDYIMKCIAEGQYQFEGDCILENKLYLGGIKSSFLKEKLKKFGITHILMVGYFMTPIFPDDFKYENIEINDNQNENILKHLVKGIKFIEQSQICYTHCQLGKSRSASFVIAYVMYKNKMHFSEAFDFVKEKRPFAFPNEGFQWQLEDFDIILNNFDYDLKKCDEFIKNFLENRKNLEESEKEYLQKRFDEKNKERLSNYSDSESDNCENCADDNNDGIEEEKNKDNLDKENYCDEMAKDKLDKENCCEEMAKNNLDKENCSYEMGKDDETGENIEKISEKIENKDVNEKAEKEEIDNREK